MEIVNRLEFEGKSGRKVFYHKPKIACETSQLFSADLTDKDELDIHLRKAYISAGDLNDESSPSIQAFEISLLPFDAEVTEPLQIPQLHGKRSAVCEHITAKDSYQYYTLAERGLSAGIQASQIPSANIEGGMTRSDQVQKMGESGKSLDTVTVEDGLCIPHSAIRLSYAANLSFRTSSIAAIMTDKLPDLQLIQFPTSTSFVREIKIKCSKTTTAKDMKFLLRIKAKVRTTSELKEVQDAKIQQNTLQKRGEALVSFPDRELIIHTGNLDCSSLYTYNSAISKLLCSVFLIIQLMPKSCILLLNAKHFSASACKTCLNLLS